MVFIISNQQNANWYLYEYNYTFTWLEKRKSLQMKYGGNIEFPYTIAMGPIDVSNSIIFLNCLLKLKAHIPQNLATLLLVFILDACDRN